VCSLSVAVGSATTMTLSGAFTAAAPAAASIVDHSSGASVRVTGTPAGTPRRVRRARHVA
jgi:hypothetical protein